jgi:hypothetical protein
MLQNTLVLPTTNTNVWVAITDMATLQEKSQFCQQ